MDYYALLMVTGTTTDGFRGLLIEPDRPKSDWPEIDVEFARPGRRTPSGWERSWKDRETFKQVETERRQAFAAVRSSVEPLSIMKFEFARGHWNQKIERSLMVAFEAKPLCTATRASELIALTAETPDRDDEWMTFRPWSTPFGRAIEKLIYPERNEEDMADQITAHQAQTRELYEHECETERVRHEPNEGIIYVGSDGRAVVFDHHGAFLFFAAENGNDVNDMGIRSIQKGLDRGLYYFTGSGWGSGPDINGEYDSGFDVETFVKAEASHFALFKSEAAATGYAADIEDYESEVDQPATPAV